MGNNLKYRYAKSNSAILFTLAGRVGKKSFGFVGTIKTAKERRFFVNPKWNL